MRSPYPEFVLTNIIRINRNFVLTVVLKRFYYICCLEGGIYFILQHFKPKRHKISTKCFSILERDEIEEGAVALEMQVKLVTDLLE